MLDPMGRKGGRVKLGLEDTGKLVKKALHRPRTFFSNASDGASGDAGSSRKDKHVAAAGRRLQELPVVDVDEDVVTAKKSEPRIGVETSAR